MRARNFCPSLKNICFHSLHCFPNESCVACFHTVSWYLDLLWWSTPVCFVWSACGTKTISSRIRLEYFFFFYLSPSEVVHLNHKLVTTRQQLSMFGLRFRTGPAISCEHWQQVPFLFPFSHSLYTTRSLAFQLCVCELCVLVLLSW